MKHAKNVIERAAALAINLSEVTGTGAKGAVLVKDLEAFADARAEIATQSLRKITEAPTLPVGVSSDALAIMRRGVNTAIEAARDLDAAKAKASSAYDIQVEAAATCSSLPEYKATVEYFANQMRRNEDNIATALGLKMGSKKDKATGAKLYSLPAAFVQATSTLRFAMGHDIPLRHANGELRSYTHIKNDKDDITASQPKQDEDSSDVAKRMAKRDGHAAADSVGEVNPEVALLAQEIMKGVKAWLMLHNANRAQKKDRPDQLAAIQRAIACLNVTPEQIGGLAKTTGNDFPMVDVKSLTAAAKGSAKADAEAA